VETRWRRNKNYSVRGPREECGVCATATDFEMGSEMACKHPVRQTPHNLKRQKVKGKVRSPYKSPASSLLNGRTPSVRTRARLPAAGRAWELRGSHDWQRDRVSYDRLQRRSESSRPAVASHGQRADGKYSYSFVVCRTLCGFILPAVMGQVRSVSGEEKPAVETNYGTRCMQHGWVRRLRG
jgi:hypothetical protein